MYTHASVKNIIEALKLVLQSEKEFLVKKNKISTGDTMNWIQYDYDFVCRYLDSYISNFGKFLDLNYKPKGNILLILSYNEPFILSIVPILNAVLSGNQVTVKPSRHNLDFVTKIWENPILTSKLSQPVKIIHTKEHRCINQCIPNQQAVYFFGGYKVASQIYKICAENFVEFYPEIEAADISIFHYQNFNELKNTDIFRESFTHAGQTCQRIHGIYVPLSIYEKFKNFISQEFLKFLQSREIFNHITREKIEELNIHVDNQIYEDDFEDLMSYNGGYPFLFFNPNDDHPILTDGTFVPTLWIKPYRSQDELIENLGKRKYFLGLNIMSRDKGFIGDVIGSTNFSRYTVNTQHINVREDEGWGGNNPSGFSGYKPWFQHFINEYRIIDE